MTSPLISEPSAEMLKEMLDALDIAVYTFDKYRKILYANTATSRMLNLSVPGIEMGAAQPDHFKENLYFDEKGDLLPYPKDSAVERALAGKSTHNLVLEHRNIRTHTHRWIQISCTPLLDEKGDFRYGIISYRDISSSKIRENRLEFLVESAKILSITMDFEKRLQEKAKLAVPSLADWCAIDIKTPDGSSRRVALAHRDPKRLEFIKEYEKRYPGTGKETGPERVIRTGKAEFISLITDEMIDALTDLPAEQIVEIKRLGLTSAMIIPIGVLGNITGALTVAHGDSGRVYTEEDFAFFTEFCHHLSILMENARLYNEIKQRDLAKDAFLASLSHELRNPLAPIKTALELLRIKKPEPGVQEEISVIEHQFMHMTRLLSDLLDATRFIRGKIELDVEQVEVAPLVEMVVLAMRPVAAEKQLTLTLEPLPLSIITLSADRTRIEQAVSNLLNNAVKFTPPGGTISVEVTRDKNTVSVHVRDTGVGVTTEEMPNIFEPYYQSERVKAGNHGLGLGLRLVHEIAQLHNGSITVKSHGLSQGSEFTLSFPLASSGTKTDLESPILKQSSSPKRILIVDDNKAATDSLVRLLRAIGWDTHGLYSAKEALAYFEHSSADIVFLDIGMPEMDGYELVRILRARGHSTIPIIALTGYGLEEDKRKAFDAGFTYHLTKPVGIRELREVLNQV